MSVLQCCVLHVLESEERGKGYRAEVKAVSPIGSPDKASSCLAHPSDRVIMVVNKLTLLPTPLL